MSESERTEFCCDDFAEQAGAVKSLAGGGWMYPPQMRPVSQFECDEGGGGWHINGCCGGGCYVVSHMKFCPYCGTKIAVAHSVRDPT